MSSTSSTNSSISSVRGSSSTTTVVTSPDDDVDHSTQKRLPSELEQAVLRTLDLYTSFGDQFWGATCLSPERIQMMDSVALLGVGSSHFAAMAGAYLMRELAGIDAHAFNAEGVAAAHETSLQLGIVLSHSAESTQTLAALEYLQIHEVRTLAITPNIASVLVRESNGFLPTREYQVGACESSHAFVLHYVALYWFAHQQAYQRGLCTNQTLSGSIDAIRAVLVDVRRVWSLQQSPIDLVVSRIASVSSIAIIGTGIHYSPALEAAQQFTDHAHIVATASESASAALLHSPALVLIVGPLDAVERKILDQAGVPSVTFGCDKDVADVVVPEHTQLLSPLVYGLMLLECSLQVAQQRLSVQNKQLSATIESK